MSDYGRRRVLVCGGRDYADAGRVWSTLTAMDDESSFEALIHGCARGADSLADSWAQMKRASGLAILGFPAQWERDGKAAGPIRNQRMLDEGRPTVVVAFPGGRGTADMVSRARKAGVPVIQVR